MVAIGGIKLENVAQVMACGAIGCAVISAVCAALDPQGAALGLLRAIQDGRRVERDAG